ncbi:competence protein [Levilactobacillus senmaizukei DSM 21775 = NBRC 103853]|uniref:Competence protein n=1 Tax=Levilactobacillus senmaizukei DSM 21775 = NBRC 103853 TaxID=1423803 RepID=A0A0R2DDV6_9LACO|nr:competence protein CoiA family protein [Levilactobacillus senmaizukei]KRN02098.1 competence protein [Levilactobacillus senmaizukei DSM 21775 = NBRC 103853]
MLIAEVDHCLVDAQAAIRGANFMCPACKERVKLCHGRRVPPYFSHFPHTQCRFVSENESRQHLLGKRQLATFFQGWGPVRFEEILPAIQQRADVWVAHETQPLVLEFQCSPINDLQVQMRTRGYVKLGIQVCWVLGKRFARQTISLSLIQRFAALRGQWGLCLFFWDVDRCQLRVVHHLHQEVGGHCGGETSWFSSLDQFCQIQPVVTSAVTPDWLQFRRRLQQRLWRADSHLRPLQEELYLRGQHLATFPIALMDTQPTWPLFGLGEAYWRILMISRLFGGAVITWAAALAEGQQVFTKIGGRLTAAGFAVPDLLETAVRAFLQTGIDAGYLLLVADGWRIVRQPTWTTEVAGSGGN